MKKHLPTLFIIILCVSCGGSGSGNSFENEVSLFIESNELPDEWSDWMIDNKSAYSQAYNKGRGDRSVRINVLYDQEIIYTAPCENEDDHMSALERLAELQFPGWDFIFSLNDSSADVTVVLAYTGTTSFADTANKIIYLVAVGIFAHEYAHTLGIGHHYCNDPRDVVNCGELPPGEGECIMARNSMSWGPTEQFLLMLSGERPDDEIIEALSNVASCITVK